MKQNKSPDKIMISIFRTIAQMFRPRNGANLVEEFNFWCHKFRIFIEAGEIRRIINPHIKILLRNGSS